jgi:hypothetical protein
MGLLMPVVVCMVGRLPEKSRQAADVCYAGRGLRAATRT